MPDEADFAWLEAKTTILGFLASLPTTIAYDVLADIACAILGPTTAADTDPDDILDVVDAWLEVEPTVGRLRLAMLCAVIDVVLLPERISSSLVDEFERRLDQDHTPRPLEEWRLRRPLRARHRDASRREWELYRRSTLRVDKLSKLMPFPHVRGH